MPIDCRIDIPRITTEVMRSIDYGVMAHVFATHNELGRLADEAVYQSKLLQLLGSTGMKATTEVPVKLSFRNVSITLSMDLVVDDKAIYELKTVAALQPIHDSQLLGYLYLTNAAHGKLVNFRTASIESRFVNTTLSMIERQQFDFDHSKYEGEKQLVSLVRELVADWGTGLNAFLYRRAILQCAGTCLEAENMLPMNSGGKQIGNQRFHLLDIETALGVTTFKELTQDNFNEFRKLLAASPLSRIQWVNISHHKVTLSTVLRE